MRIIGNRANDFFWKAGRTPCLGFISGPARAVGGIVQAVINIVLAILLAIPSYCNSIKKTSSWHFSNLKRDCYYGTMHTLRGILEALPFSSFIIKAIEHPTSTNRKIRPFKDHPFVLEAVSYSNMSIVSPLPEPTPPVMDRSSTEVSADQSSNKVSSPKVWQSYGDPLSRRLRSHNDSNCKGGLGGTYITTNEVGLKEVMEVLAKLPPVAESCHIGFSSWYNFNIMAMRQSSRGLICDFNPHNKAFIERTLQIIRRTLTREDFVKEMSTCVKQLEEECIKTVGTSAYNECINLTLNVGTGEENFHGAEDLEDEVRQELFRKGSWLATDEAFRHIKSLAMTDRIAAITVDIRDTPKFNNIAKLLKDNDIPIDSLYLSNISKYMEKEDKAAFKSSVKAMTKPETIIINCPKYRDGYVASPESPEEIILTISVRSSEQTVRFGSEFQTPEDYEGLFPTEFLCYDS